MIRESLLKQVFFLILIIAVLHIAAVALHFYWSLWWYDLVLHYLGGIWIALASLWFIFFSGYTSVKAKSAMQCFIIVLLSALAVGIFWELFEFMLGASANQLNYATDTMIDLIMDFAGALSGYLYFVMMKYERLLLKQ